MLDADIYGPSQPTMTGISGKPQSEDGKTMQPLVNHELSGHVHRLHRRARPGHDLAWPHGHPGAGAAAAPDQLAGDLDYLLVDMPPGTGDIQLTLSQRVPLTGAVIVTTPQDIALMDAKKGLTMFEKVNVPILGIVENMAIYCCPNCGHTEHIFGAEGGRRMAEQYGTELLGSLPLQLSIREQADSGRPTVVAEPEGAVAQQYKAIARRLAAKVAKQSKDFSSKFPTITVSKGT